MAQLGTHDDDANRRFGMHVAALLVMGGFTIYDAEPDWHVLYAHGERLDLAVKRINRASERAIRAPGLPPEAFGPAFDAAAAHVLGRVGALADRAHVVGAYLVGSGMQSRFAEDGAAAAASRRAFATELGRTKGRVNAARESRSVTRERSA